MHPHRSSLQVRNARTSESRSAAPSAAPPPDQKRSCPSRPRAARIRQPPTCLLVRFGPRPTGQNSIAVRREFPRSRRPGSAAVASTRPVGAERALRVHERCGPSLFGRTRRHGWAKEVRRRPWPRHRFLQPLRSIPTRARPVLRPVPGQQQAWLRRNRRCRVHAGHCRGPGVPRRPAAPRSGDHEDACCTEHEPPLPFAFSALHPAHRYAGHRDIRAHRPPGLGSTRAFAVLPESEGGPARARFGVMRHGRTFSTRNCRFRGSIRATRLGAFRVTVQARASHGAGRASASPDRRSDWNRPRWADGRGLWSPRSERWVRRSGISPIRHPRPAARRDPRRTRPRRAVGRPDPSRGSALSDDPAHFPMGAGHALAHGKRGRGCRLHDRCCLRTGADAPSTPSPSGPYPLTTRHRPQRAIWRGPGVLDSFTTGDGSTPTGTTRRYVT
jgi:hypothetical protein